MNREQVLEDVLRQDAAHVQIDPGALSAILAAPKPSDSNRSRQPDTTQTASSGSGSAASSAGRSFFRRMLRFIGITTVTVVVATVLAAAVAGATGPHCPALAIVNPILSGGAEELGSGADVDDIVTCEARTEPLTLENFEEEVPGLQQAIDNRSDGALGDDETQRWLDCINEASTPFSLGTLLQSLPDKCLAAIASLG